MKVSPNLGTLVWVFFSFRSPITPTKGSQDENMKALKWVQNNQSVAINQEHNQT